MDISPNDPAIEAAKITAEATIRAAWIQTGATAIAILGADALLGERVVELVLVVQEAFSKVAYFDKEIEGGNVKTDGTLTGASIRSVKTADGDSFEIVLEHSVIDYANALDALVKTLSELLKALVKPPAVGRLKRALGGMPSLGRERGAGS